MARISFSALVEELVGKLAGSVFQDSYFGMQVRTRVSPRNPQTQYQQLRRGEFGYLSAGWRNLTSIQRQTFIDAASTPPAALNLYLQANVNLTLIEEPTITTYVPSADPGSMAIEFFDASEESVLIRATGAVTTVPAGTKLLIQVTDTKPPTRIFNSPSNYSPVISFDEGTDLSMPTDILSAWQSRYGQMTQNKRICLNANLIDKSNGLRGATVNSCTITEEMATKYIPLFNKLSTTANAGAGLTTLQTITIPANQFTANGQKIIGEFTFQMTGGIAVKTIEINFDGTNYVSGNFTSSDPINLRIQMMRVDSTNMRGDYIFSRNGVVQEVSLETLSGFDFTAPFNIVISGQGTASNQVNLVASWMDFVKEP